MAVDKDRLFKKLEHVGEYVVRENLANGVYGENRRPLVEEWLEQFSVPDEADSIQEQGPELADEQDRPATPEITPAKSHERPLGRVGLIVVAMLIVGYLIYFFGWR